MMYDGMKVVVSHRQREDAITKRPWMHALILKHWEPDPNGGDFMIRSTGSGHTLAIRHMDARPDYDIGYPEYFILHDLNDASGTRSLHLTSLEEAVEQVNRDAAELCGGWRCDS